MSDYFRAAKELKQPLMDLQNQETLEEFDNGMTINIAIP
jgi:hypothetical protein